MKTEAMREYIKTRQAVVIDILVITSLWGISLLIVNPFGDFPLNDDWSFGLAVKQLIESGEFRPTGWTSMSLITQTLWGSLFCIPSGFSFNALRLSTLTLSLTGILGTYFLIMELRKSRCLAVIASLTLGFSPIFFALSNTFMTDVPYIAMTILVAICFIRSLGNNSDFALIMGTTLAIAATLTRQLAISLPLAYAISLLLTREVTLRNIVRAAIPPILCIVALLSFQHWLSITDRLPELYHAFTDDLLRALTKPITILIFAENAYVAVSYLGCFLMPVLLFVLGGVWESHRSRVIAFIIYSTGLIVAGTVSIASISGKSAVLLPVVSSLDIGNIIIKSGIGPLTLPNADIFSIPDLPFGFWLAVTAAGFLGAVLLITVISLNTFKLFSKMRSARLESNEVTAVFLLLCAGIYLLPLFIVGFYDRYLVPTIPILAAASISISPYTPRTIKKGFFLSSVVAILVLSIFAVCATRDYLEWNRVRWGALDELMKNKNAKAEDIDGGFEFNGWYLYDPKYKHDPNKSWWWVHDDIYKISFGRIPGYRVIEEYTFVHWLLPYTGRIVVQKRIMGTPRNG